MMIGALCTWYRSNKPQHTGGGYRMPAFPFGAANSECDFPNNCSLSLPFVRCIPEINTKAVILSILICLFFLLFIIMLAFISTSLPLILINNSIGHLLSQNAINAKVNKFSYPAKRLTIYRQIQFRFHLFAKCVVPMVYITFSKQMEVWLYLPVYRRSFRGGNSICSPWRLSRFVTKLFICQLQWLRSLFSASDNAVLCEVPHWYPWEDVRGAHACS